MLAYRNERVLTRQGQIHPYFPLVRVEVTADVVVFRPQPGKRLGKEAQMGCGMLNCLLSSITLHQEAPCCLLAAPWAA